MQINIKEIPHYKYLKQIVNDDILEEIVEFGFEKGFIACLDKTDYGDLDFEKDERSIEWVEDENTN